MPSPLCWEMKGEGRLIAECALDLTAHREAYRNGRKRTKGISSRLIGLTMAEVKEMRNPHYGAYNGRIKDKKAEPHIYK